jgi:hypothetical protein
MDARGPFPSPALSSPLPLPACPRSSRSSLLRSRPPKIQLYRGLGSAVSLPSGVWGSVTIYIVQFKSKSSRFKSSHQARSQGGGKRGPCPPPPPPPAKSDESPSIRKRREMKQLEEGRERYVPLVSMYIVPPRFPWAGSHRGPIPIYAISEKIRY